MVQPDPHSQGAPAARLHALSTLSPSLALAVAALLGSACDVRAVDALAAAVERASSDAAEGSSTALDALIAMLAVPMTPDIAEQYQAGRWRRDGGPPLRALHSRPAAAPGGAGAVVWVALQLCQDAGFQSSFVDTHAPVLSPSAAYRLLGVSCFGSSFVCSRHLVQLPEVHAMVADHIDAWLQASDCVALGVARRRAAGAVNLILGLPRVAAPAPGCHLGQHMPRLVSAMRPCLRECAMTDSIAAPLSAAHVATQYPLISLACGAGAAVLKHVLYTPDRTGVACPSALRILAAELVHADAAAAAGEPGGSDLLTVLQQRLVGL